MDLAPRGSAHGGRSCDCSGAVGRAGDPHPAAVGAPQWHRAPQTPTHIRVNGPESFCRVQRGRCEGWGCFPAFQVGSPRLSCILHPSRTRWGAGGSRGAPGRVWARRNKAIRAHGKNHNPPLALARSRPPRPALPARSRTEIRPGRGRRVATSPE